MNERIEFNMHLYLSRIDGMNSVRKILDRMKKFGMDTIAITNFGSVKDLVGAYYSAKKREIKVILGMEALYRDGRIYCESNDDDNFNRIVILVKDIDGKKNLYKLVSECYKNGYAELKNRESLLIGLSTAFSNIIGSLVVRQSDNKILEKIKPFDFILVAPQCDHKHNERILSLADKANTLVIASNSPYYLSEKDANVREALRYANNIDPDDDVDSILYSTEDMLDAFSYLGERAKEVVIDNGYKLAELISDDVPPIPAGTFYSDTKQAYEKNKSMFGSDNVIKFGYTSLQVNKSAMSWMEKPDEDSYKDGCVSEEEQDAISESWADAFLKTKVDPRFSFIIPHGMEIEDFTPIEYVEDDDGNRVAVTHIDCNDLYEILFSIVNTTNDSNVISTGMTGLDALLEGGFRKGDLNIIASRPAMGKSAFALLLAANMAKSGKKVCFFSLEMPENMVKDRISKHGNAEVPLIIDDASKITPKYIRKKLEAEKADVAIIDYLGLVFPNENGNSRAEEVAEIAFELRKIAEELNVLVICAAQLSRKSSEHLSELSCLLPTEIEQETSVIITLYRDAYYHNTDSDHAEIIVAKNKYGSIGTIPATFDKEKLLFIEKEL